MRLKTRIKWWYYNSFMSVFLMSRFNLFLTFTLSELYEIELARNSIHRWLKKMLDEVGDKVVSHSLEVHYRNEIHLCWYDSSGNKHHWWTVCIPSQFNFDKHKWAVHLC